MEELWEPEIPIRLKVKGEREEGDIKQEEKVKTEIDYGLPKATEMPVWKAKGWSKPGEIKQEIKEEPATDVLADATTETPTDSATLPPPSNLPAETEPEQPPVKNEPSEATLDEVAPPSSGGGLFRKRKGAPTTAGTRNTKKR